mmetsp:Transcript_93887/g.176473  ORF Transcript_93887/g.176473 Transcript_93887/m.176473 type:complete len:489 (-) Transcript_93887:488-1954(-)
MLLFNSPALLLETTALLKFKAAPPLLLCLYPLKLLLLGSFFCKRPALAFLLCLLVFNLCMLFRLFSSLCLLLSYPPGLLLSLRYLCCCSSFCVFPATGLFLSFTPSGCSKVLCFFPASCSFFCLQFLYLCYLFCLFSASNCFCRFPLVNFCDFFCLFSALCSLVGLLFVSLCQRLCPLTAPSFFLRFSVLFLCEPLRHLSFFCFFLGFLALSFSDPFCFFAAFGFFLSLSSLSFCSLFSLLTALRLLQGFLPLRFREPVCLLSAHGGFAGLLSLGVRNPLRLLAAPGLVLCLLLLRLGFQGLKLCHLLCLLSTPGLLLRFLSLSFSNLFCLFPPPGLLFFFSISLVHLHVSIPMNILLLIEKCLQCLLLGFVQHSCTVFCPRPGGLVFKILLSLFQIVQGQLFFRLVEVTLQFGLQFIDGLLWVAELDLLAIQDERLAVPSFIRCSKSECQRAACDPRRLTRKDPSLFVELKSEYLQGRGPRYLQVEI